MKRFTSLAAAVCTAAFLGATYTQLIADSNINQRTYLTFSAPVQVPGVTLPAGKYVFRLADTSSRSVMQVFDDRERTILGQWFFIPVNRTTEQMSAANGKPVVTFGEAPVGVAPPIQYFFYPTDLTGKEFIYPKGQAVRIAAATHENVLATESDASKGGEAAVVEITPNGNEAEYQASADDSETTATLSSDKDQAAIQDSELGQSTGTSGVAEQAPAQGEPQQAVSSELPKTASTLPYFGLFGVLALIGGFGLRLARVQQ